eukprot:TRINITY_DN1931_c0_g1_i1.p1 TRINITY_DN1931_c0_g1~~TRINITY_DN1931_c0_g1_i1.p1  ORF type:complete len:274 (+),score=78.76 TRINITY_DN1931_c0_g1_i1:101-922(+)
MRASRYSLRCASRVLSTRSATYSSALLSSHISNKWTPIVSSVASRYYATPSFGDRTKYAKRILAIAKEELSAEEEDTSQQIQDFTEFIDRKGYALGTKVKDEEALITLTKHHKDRGITIQLNIPIEQEDGDMEDNDHEHEHDENEEHDHEHDHDNDNESNARDIFSVIVDKTSQGKGTLEFYCSIDKDGLKLDDVSVSLNDPKATPEETKFWTDAIYENPGENEEDFTKYMLSVMEISAEELRDLVDGALVKHGYDKYNKWLSGVAHFMSEGK